MRRQVSTTALAAAAAALLAASTAYGAPAVVAEVQFADEGLDRYVDMNPDVNPELLLAGHGEEVDEAESFLDVNLSSSGAATSTTSVNPTLLASSSSSSSPSNPIGPAPPTAAPNTPGSPIQFPVHAPDMAYLKHVKGAISEKDRLTLLESNGGEAGFSFDFGNPPTSAINKNKGGFMVSATGENFPATLGQGMSTQLNYLGPCGLVPPHLHARAAQTLIVTRGTIKTQFLAGDGTHQQSLSLKELQSAHIPRGAVHYEMNPTCEPAGYISAFNSDDPGMTVVAPTFLGFDNSAIIGAFGNPDINAAYIDSMRSTTPAGIVEIVRQCQKSCEFRARNDTGDHVLGKRDATQRPFLAEETIRDKLSQVTPNLELLRQNPRLNTKAKRDDDDVARVDYTAIIEEYSTDYEDDVPHTDIYADADNATETGTDDAVSDDDNTEPDEFTGDFARAELGDEVQEVPIQYDDYLDSLDDSVYEGLDLDTVPPMYAAAPRWPSLKVIRQRVFGPVPVYPEDEDSIVIPYAQRTVPQMPQAQRAPSQGQRFASQAQRVPPQAQRAPMRPNSGRIPALLEPTPPPPGVTDPADSPAGPPAGPSPSGPDPGNSSASPRYANTTVTPLYSRPTSRPLFPGVSADSRPQYTSIRPLSHAPSYPPAPTHAPLDDDDEDDEDDEDDDEGGFMAILRAPQRLLAGDDDDDGLDLYGIDLDSDAAKRRVDKHHKTVKLYDDDGDVKAHDAVDEKHLEKRLFDRLDEKLGEQFETIRSMGAEVPDEEVEETEDEAGETSPPPRMHVIHFEPRPVPPSEWASDRQATVGNAAARVLREPYAGAKIKAPFSGPDIDMTRFKPTERFDLADRLGRTVARMDSTNRQQKSPMGPGSMGPLEPPGPVHLKPERIARPMVDVERPERLAQPMMPMPRPPPYMERMPSDSGERRPVPMYGTSRQPMASPFDIMSDEPMGMARYGADGQRGPPVRFEAPRPAERYRALDRPPGVSMQPIGPPMGPRRVSGQRYAEGPFMDDFPILHSPEEVSEAEHESGELRTGLSLGSPYDTSTTNEYDDYNSEQHVHAKRGLEQQRVVDATNGGFRHHGSKVHASHASHASRKTPLGLDRAPLQQKPFNLYGPDE